MRNRPTEKQADVLSPPIDEEAAKTEMLRQVFENADPETQAGLLAYADALLAAFREYQARERAARIGGSEDPG